MCLPVIGFWCESVNAQVCTSWHVSGTFVSLESRVFVYCCTAVFSDLSLSAGKLFRHLDWNPSYYNGYCILHLLLQDGCVPDHCPSD